MLRLLVVLQHVGFDVATAEHGAAGEAHHVLADAVATCEVFATAIDIEDAAVGEVDLRRVRAVWDWCDSEPPRVILLLLLLLLVRRIVAVVTDIAVVRCTNSLNARFSETTLEVGEEEKRGNVTRRRR